MPRSHLAKRSRKLKFSKPSLPVYSNTTGQVHSSDPEQIRQNLVGHILNPVRFKDEIEAIYSQGGSIFVEIGPRNVLTNLVKDILEGKPHAAVALNPNARKDSDRQYREAIAQLIVLGLDLRHYDTYSMQPKRINETKGSPISVMLNGGLYLTEKTHTAFENAVAQKDTLDLVAARPETKTSLSTAEVTRSQDLAPRPAPTVNPPGTDQPGIDQMHAWLQSGQDETLKSHNQFLSNDGEYIRFFGQITRQELDLLSGNLSQQTLEQINNALQTLDRSMALFHQHQAETLRVHEQYLHNQAELVDSLLRLPIASEGLPATMPVSKPVDVQPIAATFPKTDGVKLNQNEPSPLESTTGSESGALAGIVPESSNLGISAEILTQSLLEIVSEKTGYPTEMLELGMDMEADLGIDSIKRVEILGAMQVRYPELPKADTAVLSEMRTLGQIVDHMVASAPAAQVADQAVLPAEKPAAPSATPLPVHATLDVETIKQALLEIVSEKTGYPTEMLDPGMDMEADLGIDSIKRVEILGALQTRFPELPKADASRAGRTAYTRPDHGIPDFGCAGRETDHPTSLFGCGSTSRCIDGFSSAPAARRCGSEIPPIS